MAKAQLKVPRSMTPKRLEVLTILGKKSKLSPEELVERSSDEFKSVAVDTAKNMTTYGYVEKDIVDGAPIFSLTEVGRFAYKNRKSIAVVSYKSRKKYNTAKNPSDTPKAAPIQRNISLEADSLADNISQVLQQNNSYRNLLLQLRDTIDAALGLEKDDDNGEDS